MAVAAVAGMADTGAVAIQSAQKTIPAPGYGFIQNMHIKMYVRAFMFRCSVLVCDVMQCASTHCTHLCVCICATIVMQWHVL